MVPLSYCLEQYIHYVHRSCEPSLCLIFINHFDCFLVSNVLIAWYILGCDEIHIFGHREEKLNAINKHYINTECDNLFF